MHSNPSQTLAAAITALDQLPDADPSLGSALGEEVALLVTLAERTRVALLKRVAVFDACGAAGSDGCGSVESWLVTRTGMTRAAAAADTALARRLFRDTERPLAATAQALQSGNLTVEHARVIARTTDDLPLDTVAQAEAVLLETATYLAPAQLATAGRRLRRMVVQDPDARAELARGERYLRLTPALFGMWAIEGLVDAETGAALQAAFDALLSTPAPDSTVDQSALEQSALDQPAVEQSALDLTALEQSALDLTALDQSALDQVSSDMRAAWLGAFGGPTGARPEERVRLTQAQRRADALGQIASGYLAAGGAPVAGGIRPHVVVTADLATLTGSSPGGLGTIRPDSRTGHGTEIGPDALRRIACDSGLTFLLGSTDPPDPAEVMTPATASEPPGDHACGTIDPQLLRALLAGIAPALGGLCFEPLQLGRTSRLVSTAQRLALNARDRGCVAPGCPAGPERCEAHHLRFWSDGGSTDLDNLALVCGFHHHLVHEQHWTLTRSPGTGEVCLRAPTS